jgi:type VI protein secretion system component Hcp
MKAMVVQIYSGTHIIGAVLVVRSRGVSGGAVGTTAGTTQQVEYLKITLTDVLVSSFLNLGNSKSTEAYPIEEVSLKSLGKIEIDYTEFGPDGRSKGTVKGGWNMKENRKVRLSPEEPRPDSSIDFSEVVHNKFWQSAD